MNETSGSPDLLLQKFLKVKDCPVLLLIKLLHCLMYDKISLQFIIAGGTGLYMIQKFFQFVWDLISEREEQTYEEA